MDAKQVALWEATVAVLTLLAARSDATTNDTTNEAIQKLERALAAAQTQTQSPLEFGRGGAA